MSHQLEHGRRPRRALQHYNRTATTTTATTRAGATGEFQREVQHRWRIGYPSVTTQQPAICSGVHQPSASRSTTKARRSASVWAAQKAERLWRYLFRGGASRGRRRARSSRDRIREKVHVSQRSEAATARQEAGHWEGDLIICRRARPVLAPHERKTRLTLMTRLAGKTAGETVAAIMAVFRRLEAGMRGSITFDNDTCFAHHALLRGMLGATTYFVSLRRRPSD
jgi:hypothetical protein